MSFGFGVMTTVVARIASTDVVMLFCWGRGAI